MREREKVREKVREKSERKSEREKSERKREIVVHKFVGKHFSNVGFSLRPMVILRLQI